MAAEWPTYGYRRITAQLHRQGWQVNHKRVQRLMRLMGLQAKIKRRKRRTTNSEHDFPRYPNLVQGLEIVHPDQVWVSDITYIRLRYAFVYLAVIMKGFNTLPPPTPRPCWIVMFKSVWPMWVKPGRMGTPSGSSGRSRSWSSTTPRISSYRETL